MANELIKHVSGNDYTKILMGSDGDTLVVESGSPVFKGATAPTTSAANYAVLSTDVLIKCDTSANNVSVDLPAAADRIGRQLTVKKIATDFAAIINPDGSEEIDGALTFPFYNRNESYAIISDGSEWAIGSAFRPQDMNVTTGAITGCIVSANGSTMFDISPGTIAIEDWSNPASMRLKLLSYPGVTGQLPPNPTTNIFTTLQLIESATDGLAELQMTSEGLMDAQTRRETVALVSVIHPAGDGVISGFTDDYQIGYGWTQVLNDMTQCRRACIAGNVITANGANLSFDRAAGTTALPFFNAASSTWLAPAVRTNAAATAQEFIKQAKDPAGPFVGGLVTVIDPDNYDNNGVITALTNNKWTVQRVFLFGQSTTMTVSYGQNVYSSQSAAEAAIETETFLEPANADAGRWICSLVVKKGTTDLSDTGSNSIVNRNID